MTTVFIDGSAGTTGLRIHDRLAGRADITLLTLPDSCRKDPAARAEALHAADIAFLCLPDDAARESAALADGADTVIIDTSTAHRTAVGWDYGFIELLRGQNRVFTSNRISNPGCHASGFLALVAPLTAAGLILPDEQLTCFSLTGYSGGGKHMIAEYESTPRSPLLDAPRQYGLAQQHKHLAEMQAVAGLTHAPLFCPVVAPFYSGMEVTVPLFASQLRGTRADIEATYRAWYRTGLVHYASHADEQGFLSAAAFAGRDDMEVSVQGNGDRLLLVARFDNLGKGASGAAIQNMNLVLGVDETTGLTV